MHFSEWLILQQTCFWPVVPFDKNTDHLLQLDLTAANKDLTPSLLQDTALFDAYIKQRLQQSGARYGYGGYNELRTMYSRSEHFGNALAEEPRRLHLGIDIWGPVGTPVYAPVGGMVHSFAFNNNPGDYGATIILSHQLDGRQFYMLYGHLSLADLAAAKEGNYLVGGGLIGHFGPPTENGNWPPHLHFQIIEDLGLYEGDYPGVCKASEAAQWLANSPDPELMLQMQPSLK
jgi:murein DD-endopeptidase MepM/ murein hydrolase activator NlpD